MIVGASAGAILLGPNVNIVQSFTPQMNTFNIKNFVALNITDKLVFPHYDREDLFKNSKSNTIEDRLKEFEAIHKCDVTRLRDDQFISIVS